MDNDDEPVGQVLNRRELLSLFGKAGVAALAGYGLTRAPRAKAQSSAAGCIVRPALTEGPYFVDEKLNRSDIRTDPSTGVAKAGVPLALAFRISRIGGTDCTPLAGAMVDVWHCDAAGVYSDVSAQNSVGKKFLRGYQMTDADGVAQFTTIYPGWYPGRAVHIHFKVRTTAGTYQTSEFTSQFFFDDTLTDQVYKAQPYAAKGTRTTRNANDGIYNQGGNQLILAAVPSGDGFAATFDLGLQVACGTTGLKGDMNADGKVDVQDAVSALRTSVGMDTPNECLKNLGDVNGDGLLKVDDAVSILRHITLGEAFSG